MRYPLASLRVVEFAGLGPAPFAAMMLADAGADVIRVARPGDPAFGGGVLERGRLTVEADLKEPDQRERIAALVSRGDVLIEGYRPGVMERLGLAPARCLEENPGLVYARMTGWGQDGPFASMAGHDINYLALTGTLHCLARRGEAPFPPLNLVADFGGGGMLLAYGVLAALIERTVSGRGQVVDAAMADGVNLLMAGVWSRMAAGRWSPEPGTNDIDTGAPYYNVYATQDGRYMAMGAVEPGFYRLALATLGMDPEPFLERQHNRETWPKDREHIAEAFRRHPFDHWSAVFADVDACVTPVLDLAEAPEWDHARARQMFMTSDGRVQPAPAPRFERAGPPRHGQERCTVTQALSRWPQRSGTSA